MEFLTIKLKPIEPLMLRGLGEFDPSSRGVYTYAFSLTLPRPSTMIGTLISALILSEEHVSECLSIDSWKDLLEKCYIEVFNEYGIEALRGPYIVRGDKLYAPIMLGKRIVFIDYNQAEYLLLKEYGDILEELFSKRASEERTAAALKLIGKVIERNSRYVIEPKSINLTGIHLRSRKHDGGGKIVEEGYIYTASYISYPPDTEVTFLLVVRDSHRILSYLHEGVVKFGGEGRVVKMNVEHSDRSNAALDNFCKAEATKYAILASPMPLIENYLNIPFIGEYTTIGLGFSTAKKRRKPISSSISEGSILRIDTRKEELKREDVLRYGLYAVLGLATKDGYYKHLGRLGYASFIGIGAVR